MMIKSFNRQAYVQALKSKDDPKTILIVYSVFDWRYGRYRAHTKDIADYSYLCSPKSHVELHSIMLFGYFKSIRVCFKSIFCLPSVWWTLNFLTTVDIADWPALMRWPLTRPLSWLPSPCATLLLNCVCWNLSDAVTQKMITLASICGDQQWLSSTLRGNQIDLQLRRCVQQYSEMHRWRRWQPTVALSR